MCKMWGSTKCGFGLLCGVRAPVAAGQNVATPSEQLLSPAHSSAGTPSARDDKQCGGLLSYIWIDYRVDFPCVEPYKNMVRPLPCLSINILWSCVCSCSGLAAYFFVDHALIPGLGYCHWSCVDIGLGGFVWLALGSWISKPTAMTNTSCHSLAILLRSKQGRK